MSEEVAPSEGDLLNARADADESQELAEYQQQNYEDNADASFGGYPGETLKESVYSFFKFILGLKDSSKVGNLDKYELGRLDLSVRNSQYLSMLGGLMHNRSVKEFYAAKAEITLATSLSKRMALLDTIVTQKRISARTVTASPGAEPPKKGFFNFGGNKNPAVQAAASAQEAA